ncbi:adenylyl-sulfate kinase [Methylobacterium sp. NEAU K]|uniref:adenylyl-sulfate kinase n=1 Tax=Methylobacterium sp. NEAU K TaxID=3064946 RepID=UPI00351E4896
MAGDIALLNAFVDAPLEIRAARDPKGPCKRARSGQITGFTGVSAPYEKSTRPDQIISARDRSRRRRSC